MRDCESQGENALAERRVSDGETGAGEHMSM
jgi:hypothetical protein